VEFNERMRESELVASQEVGHGATCDKGIKAELEQSTHKAPRVVSSLIVKRLRFKL
jgi:hypothetical protein